MCLWFGYFVVIVAYVLWPGELWLGKLADW